MGKSLAEELETSRPILYLDDVINTINSTLQDFDNVDHAAVGKTIRMSIKFAFAGAVWCEAYTDKLQKAKETEGDWIKFAAYTKLRKYIKDFLLSRHDGGAGGGDDIDAHEDAESQGAAPEQDGVDIDDGVAEHIRTLGGDPEAFAILLQRLMRDAKLLVTLGDFIKGHSVALVS